MTVGLSERGMHVVTDLQRIMAQLRVPSAPLYMELFSLFQVVVFDCSACKLGSHMVHLRPQQADVCSTKAFIYPLCTTPPSTKQQMEGVNTV